MIIAIDGPAASGKSTVAKILARHLGYAYIDTGAMYRALTLKALNEGVDLKNGPLLGKIAKHICVQFIQDKKWVCRTLLDGLDVTDAIRNERITKNVSIVSAYAGVRKYMILKQRGFCKTGNVIMEGRDIGTVVMPTADKKFYLDASVISRAKRRQSESIKNMKMRDSLDRTRKDSPLIVANDAVYIDTTDMTVDEVCSCIASFVLS